MTEGESKKKTIILGLSCFYHDSAAAILIDGKIVAAAQEERFTRKKHDENFPKNAIDFCLKQARIEIKDLDHVVFYDKPITKFERLIRTFIRVWPMGLSLFILSMKSWLKNKLWIEHTIKKELGYEKEVLFTEHHYSHAASAYYGSEFTDATIVTIDGVGEWDTTTIGFGRGNKIGLTKSIHFPHSLGLLYSAITYFLGFKVNSAEYKVMGLAPYGNTNKYYEKIKSLIDVCDDGSYELKMKYFEHDRGLRMTTKRLEKLLGIKRRLPESELTQDYKDIAAALQKITEEIVVKIVQYAKKEHNSENLCLAGGVALNCVANGKISKLKLFKNIYIQPASGDAGGAIGAASFIYFDILGNKKIGSVMDDIYLGPEFSEKEIKIEIENKKLKYKHLDSNEELLEEVSDLISKDNVIGWFNGRMEFGPRALGARSILADARNKENWQRVNLKIKFRESFRPFAPSILADKVDEYFDTYNQQSPHMLIVAKVKNEKVPAVTHVDKTARVQTVSEKDNFKYYGLIKNFYQKTGCPVIINTSFNVRGEPIVCTPIDAINCFINTDMDYLVLENFVICKSNNNDIIDPSNRGDYLDKFELD